MNFLTNELTKKALDKSNSVYPANYIVSGFMNSWTWGYLNGETDLIPEGVEKCVDCSSVAEELIEKKIKEEGVKLLCSSIDSMQLYSLEEKNVLFAYKSSPFGKNRTITFKAVHPRGCSFIQEVRKIIRDNPPITSREPFVYTIAFNGKNYCLDSIGIGGLPFEENNYSAEVAAQYYELVEDLNRKEPYGRLSIIDGPPGTGKTYLVRALINDAPDCRFILVPPHLIPHLGNPEMVSFFIKTRSEEGKNGSPFVLILEDADACLRERGMDNISAISALLNLTDGIVGSLINFRIVATANVKTLEIDPALLRSGRLSVNMTIPELSNEHAAEIYMRLTKTEDRKVAFSMAKKCKTLSDVYLAAKGKNLDKKDKDNRKIRGFGA